MTLRASRQLLVHDWVQRCFGPKVEPRERARRLVEEALELAQAVGCEPAELEQLVAYVFARPTGRPEQEVGGVAITLLAFCAAHGIDLADAELQELRRILAKPTAYFRDRHNAKADAGVAARVPT